MAALANRSSRPLSSPRQTAPAAEARICELRRHHPRWGPLRIHYELSKESVTPLPSRMAVYRVLVRHELMEPHPQRRRKQDYTRWERSRPMELWQMDVMGGIFLRSGQELKLVSGIDDHSRFCVYARLVERATAPAVCRAFLDALERHGVPEEMLTDNGRVFTNRIGRVGTESMFDRICRENGIVHRLTKVRSPTTTGKVERFHKTLREELLAGRRFDSIEEAQSIIDAWVEEYNTARPHQAIAMLTPAARFRQVPRAETPPTPKPVSVDEGLTVKRRVATDGTVTLAYERYALGSGFIGREITIQIEPTVLHFFERGRYLKTSARRGTKEIWRLTAHKADRRKKTTPSRRGAA